MTCFKRCLRFAAAAGAVGAALHASAGARAAEPVTPETLDAVVRAFGFLETAPADGQFIVAVVYAADAPDAQQSAARIAARLENAPGPKRSRLRASVVSVDAFVRSGERFDAALLAPGEASTDSAVIEAVRRRRIVSVSSDRDCLETRCCVLMVRAGRGVEIVLDTKLAAEIGARFSSVFTMMVTRQ